uniref:Glutathione S-transferase n=1 Tax=Trieres chinensis TaxID=1514140 RepID=A0A7S1ZPF8_TRICV|mmetsp:Transcript_29787/g.60866  ORF Transcript_29787/g.60866 Transcript_29787/m.60866 type:complete len:228 (+) Transcript_29787:40-723(+)|eukprot:CAMPEP_0183291158 /NCGR_PEP_ID=MMETSP0160_2-20130417/667_1 /TAXON_ID=2839 ORGANISM="Odontella Sinensis, Strain Grunow 1884" /NCGR_SAMPLE_ID=MMETSP0160_2 /ASSEMBLY_ACC=CAM_ASM_000250 /LENGTH=227 /DNA_ID=CAMNT_0025451917 /DNA_START=43 /DNA_END=726 /DNA_ORIENTATION=-
MASPFPAGKPTLIYWDLCGRADPLKCMLYAGKIDFDIDTETANAWPSSKPKTPFAQLPVLSIGEGSEELTLSQMGCMTRYAARLGGIYPDDPVKAAKCDMIIGACDDLFSYLFKPELYKNYAGEKDAKISKWKEVVEGPAKTQFGYLEAILEKWGTPYFSGENPSAADVYFFGVYGVYEEAECGIEDVLSQFPKLKAVKDGVLELGNLRNYKRSTPYFTANPDHPSF